MMKIITNPRIISDELHDEIAVIMKTTLYFSPSLILDIRCNRNFILIPSGELHDENHN